MVPRQPIGPQCPAHVDTHGAEHHQELHQKREHASPGVGALLFRPIPLRPQVLPLVIASDGRR